MVARERTRLFLELQTSPYRTTALAPRLFALLHARPAAPHGADPALTSWVVSTARWLESNRLRHGVPIPQTPAPFSHSDAAATAAGLYGRALGFATFRQTALHKARAAGVVPRADGPGVAGPDGPWTLAPRASPPTAHVLDLHLSYHQGPPAAGGGLKGHTPLSATGPGCSGAILSLCDAPGLGTHVSILATLLLGREALFTKAADPAPCMAFPSAFRRGPGPGLLLVTRRWHRAASKGVDMACPLCTVPNSPLGPYHVLLACTSPLVAQARAAVDALIPRLISQLAASLAVAKRRHQDGAFRRLPPASIAEERALGDRTAAGCATWPEPERLFVSFRLLLASPWPRSAVPSEWAVASALGCLFDTTCVPHHLLRGLANSWTKKAGRACRSLLDPWSAGVQAAWMAAGGPPDEGACFTTEPLPADLSPSLVPLCGREAAPAPP